MSTFYIKTVPILVLLNCIFSLPIWMAMSIIELGGQKEIDIVLAGIGLILTMVANSFTIQREKRNTDAFSVSSYIIFVVIMPSLTSGLVLMEGRTIVSLLEKVFSV
jgi:hypothetical protein